MRLRGSFLRTRLGKVSCYAEAQLRRVTNRLSSTLGGSLGWKAKGSLDPKFEEIAFNLETSTTGSPKIGEAKTGFGYHIIMVSRRYLSLYLTTSLTY